MDGQELTFESWGELCKASSAKESEQYPHISPEYKRMRFLNLTSIVVFINFCSVVTKHIFFDLCYFDNFIVFLQIST